ncbi:MAG: DUF805 domain-containing protein [Flavobacteriaceae bacterium]|nr:DUF805 domain-containing protein [Flavobacteriaceae bacterium]
MQWYLLVLKKYNVFTGRARRSEYWYFVLINLFNSFLTSYMDRTFGTFDEETKLGYINMAYAMVVFIPNIAVNIRRMHDVGKSGWFMLIPIYNIVLAVTPGVVGKNQYGPDPKDEEIDHTISN